MDAMRPTPRALAHSIAALVTVSLLAGCEWVAPITEKPTRPVDERLFGDWRSENDEDELRVRGYDDWNYVVLADDDILRIHHSDVRGVPYVSARLMAPNDMRYMYFAWALSPDGETLTIRSVNENRVPYDTKPSADVRKLLERFRSDPDLFNDDSVRYTRVR
jgi:hypothetical protein